MSKIGRKMSKKRIFIAVDISEEARAAVVNYIDELRHKFSNLRIGWERPEKLHLTLKFFGDVADNRVTDIQNLVEKIAKDHKRLRIKIAGTGLFPNARNPRILWLGVGGEKDKLGKIAKTIESACEN